MAEIRAPPPPAGRAACPDRPVRNRSRSGIHSQQARLRRFHARPTHTACALKPITVQRVLFLDLTPDAVLAPDPRQQWYGRTLHPPLAAAMPLPLARARIHEASSELN